MSKYLPILFLYLAALLLMATNCTITKGQESASSTADMRAGDQTDNETHVISSAPLEYSNEEPIYLRLDAKGKFYDFYYGFQEDEWIPLMENADGTILSTQTAGGFVGTVFGMYVYWKE
ncbi:MAG: hypothetical protein WD059_07395 [Balneolaceae bacterium]